MFATENEYEEAVRDSQIRRYENGSQRNRVITNILLLLLFATIGYFAYGYYKNNRLSISDKSVMKKSVLGVTHKVETSIAEVESDEYLLELKKMEADIIEDKKSKLDIGKEMDVLMNSDSGDDSEYENAIAKEIQ